MTTLPVTATVNLKPEDFPKIAREIAIDVRSLEDILGSFKLTKNEYEKLLKNEIFKQILESTKQEWESAISSMKRIQVKSAVILEDALPQISARLVDPNENFEQVIKAAGLLTKIVGLDNEEGKIGEKIQININMGEDKKLEIVKEIKQVIHDPVA